MPVYLRYGKIKGEVKEPAHRGWIEIQTFQWNVSRGPAGSSSSRESGSPSVSEVTVTKPIDSASPLLQQEAISGEGVVAIVDFVKDGQVSLRYTLTGTLITGYSVGRGGDKPLEALSFNFRSVVVQQTPGGPPPPP